MYEISRVQYHGGLIRLTYDVDYYLFAPSNNQTDVWWQRTLNSEYLYALTKENDKLQEYLTNYNFLHEVSQFFVQVCSLVCLFVQLNTLATIKALSCHLSHISVCLFVCLAQHKPLSKPSPAISLISPGPLSTTQSSSAPVGTLLDSLVSHTHLLSHLS